MAVRPARRAMVSGMPIEMIQFTENLVKPNRMRFLVLFGKC